jgi:hypothetical protein
LVHAHVARPKVVDFATAARGTIDFAAMPAMVFALGVGKENAFGFGQGGGIGRDGKTLGQHHAAIGLMVRDPFHVNDWLNLSKLLGFTVYRVQHFRLKTEVKVHFRGPCRLLVRRLQSKLM